MLRGLDSTSVVRGVSGDMSPSTSATQFWHTTRIKAPRERRDTLIAHVADANRRSACPKSQHPSLPVGTYSREPRELTYIPILI
jgi:hypothetical protein